MLSTSKIRKNKNKRKTKMYNHHRPEIDRYNLSAYPVVGVRPDFRYFFLYTNSTHTKKKIRFQSISRVTYYTYYSGGKTQIHIIRPFTYMLFCVVYSSDGWLASRIIWCSLFLKLNHFYIFFSLDGNVVFFYRWGLLNKRLHIL